jgi:hypothetical protein
VIGFEYHPLRHNVLVTRSVHASSVVASSLWALDYHAAILHYQEDSFHRADVSKRIAIDSDDVGG